MKNLVFFFFVNTFLVLLTFEKSNADIKPKQYVDVVSVTSNGGIKAWLVRDTTNPIINFRFAFRAGASMDPDGKEGLANMVSALLDEGSGNLSSLEFQQRLEDQSIILTFDTGLDTFYGRLKTLSSNKESAFDLLGSAINSPRFDDEPVNRIRKQILARLRRSSQDPNDVASRSLSKELFPDHPYGRPIEGTSESVKAIEKTDLINYVSKKLAKDNLVVGVVGDIRPDELRYYLDRVFLNLPPTSEPSDIEETVPNLSGVTKIVKMPVPQSAIVFAQMGVKRNDPNFYSAYILNHILGGGSFTSRLYREIREKRGLAYSIGSYLFTAKHTALIKGYGGTSNKRVGETIDVIKNEWRYMAEKGITAKTLADAKTYLIGSYPLRFTSSGNVASILVSMQLENLGINHLEIRNSMINGVNLNDVNGLARKMLDPNKLVIVVAGSPEGLGTTPK